MDRLGRLWVADYNSNRVLRFDAVSSKPNGAPADGVLGQSDFVPGTVAITAFQFSGPVGIAMNQGGELLVASGDSHRVLQFDNAASLANGASATVILGQPKYISFGPGLAANRMNNPYRVCVTVDDSLWVSEFENNRCMRFDNASTITSEASATGVIGQPNFTSAVPATTSRGLFNPFFQPCVDTTGEPFGTGSIEFSFPTFPRRHHPSTRCGHHFSP